MRSHCRPVERGFSLVELMVAMTATLVVTGAVYGLVVAGNSAFRREPAMADRQQNIRVALDIISQDAFRAGYGLPSFAQAFTDGLDALGDTGSSGEKTDELEIFAAADCPYLKVCEISAQGTGSSVTTFQMPSSCYHFPTFVVLGDDTKWGLYWAEEHEQGTASCESGGGGNNGHFTVPHGVEPLVNPPGGLQGWVPQWMMVGQAIRYRIHAEPGDPPDFQRSEWGGRDLPDGGGSSWQTIARGIEDFQVEYETGSPDWQKTPGVITCEPNCTAPTAAEYARLVRRVRITLSARALENNLAGQRTSAVGNAVRGELSTDIAPRAANTTLQAGAGEL